jgi:hypothetical protein
MYHSQVLCVFSVVNNGVLSISAAKRRIKPEVTSQFDSLTSIVRPRFHIGIQYTFIY